MFFVWARRVFRFALGCAIWLGCLPAFASERPAPAGAPVARDITARCIVTPSYNQDQAPAMLTEDLATFWEAPMDTHDGERPYVQVDTPPDEPAYGLYIVWAYTPGDWQVLVPNPEWERYAHMGDDDPLSRPRWVAAGSGGAHGFVHEYLPLDGLTSLRIQPRRMREHPFSIAALHVLGEGETPDWVQLWQPIPPLVDLMVISAHPDDELIYFGGTLPTYAGDRGLDTAVVYMTYSTRSRRSELLNGLWAAGVRSYPVLGDFLDGFTASAEQAAAICGDEQVSAFITEQLRRYKPKVVVSHDLNGEYGHGMHRLTAQKTLEAVADLVWDEGCFPESAAAYGVCDVEKLYLHLYPEETVIMDWRAPLEAFGGRTAVDVACQAFGQHASQQAYRVALEDDPHSCFLFGLAFTLVGPDEEGGDFFEHVTLWREEEE